MALRASRKTLSVLSTLLFVTVVASSTQAQDNTAPFGPVVQQLKQQTPDLAPAESEADAEPLADEAMTSADDADQEAVVSENATASLESRPLGLPSNKPSPIAQPVNAANSTPTTSVWWLRTALALGLVIALILLLRAALQKIAGAAGGLSNHLGAGGRAPSGVLEVLGRFPVARGHTLVLLKMDRRILLLGQTASGFTPLSEVRDPDEVASLLIKSRDEEGQSMTARFNSILHEAERDQDLLDEPISIVDRDTDSDDASAEDDPASSLRNRLLGLRGLEA